MVDMIDYGQFISQVKNLNARIVQLTNNTSPLTADQKNQLQATKKRLNQINTQRNNKINKLTTGKT